MGYKLVTIKDLSEELQLNQSTICRALKNSPKVGKATIEKVHQFAQLRQYNVNWRNKTVDSDAISTSAMKDTAGKCPKVTIYDVAEYMGISAATVSRALNQWPNTSKKTMERVMQVANEMGYTANVNAKRLRAKSEQDIPRNGNSVLTVHTIAKDLNLSASTVSRALLNNDRVAVQTRNKVVSFAIQMGFTPSELARKLKAQMKS